MSKSTKEVAYTSLRLPRKTLEKMHLLMYQHKIRTGFEITLSSLFRVLLEEGLNSRGITDHVLENFKKSSSEESAQEVSS